MFDENSSRFVYPALVITKAARQRAADLKRKGIQI
jgi:hypothetical protein